MINPKRNHASRSFKYVCLLPIILLSFFFISQAKAKNKAIKTVVVDSTSMKVFEGVYQLKDNKYAFFKIVVANNTLVAKNVDGDQQLILSRKSDLAFEAKDDDGDETISVIFSKNDAGEIVQASVANKDILIKVKNYKPITALNLSAAQLKAYEGKYQFEQKKDVYLIITATPDGLVLKQLWDGKEIPFIAVADNEFINKQKLFPLKFTKDADGSVTKVLAFNRDSWDRVKQ